MARPDGRTGKCGPPTFIWQRFTFNALNLCETDSRMQAAGSTVASTAPRTGGCTRMVSSDRAKAEVSDRLQSGTAITQLFANLHDGARRVR